MKIAVIDIRDYRRAMIVTSLGENDINSVFSFAEISQEEFDELPTEE